MINNNSSNNNTSDNSGPRQPSMLMKYMGLGAQFFATILIALLLGWKADDFFGLTTPVLIWVLPLLAIVGTLIKIIKETSKQSKK